MRLLQILFFAYLLCSSILAETAYGAVMSPRALNLTTSIQPIGLILSELTQQTKAHITVLIPANQSSHDFTLKPKDIMQLEKSDLVVWLGPELEVFFQKPIQALSSNRPHTIITLLASAEIKKQLLPLRTGAQWQDSQHDHHGHAHAHAHPEQTSSGIDPHIWITPNFTLEIAKIIAKRLIALNPAEAKIYFANFEAFAHQLISIDTQYREAFAHPVHRYLVLHDSFQYIEKQYDLPIAGVLPLHVDKPTSIKMLREAQSNIAIQHVSCILGEPPFQAKLIQVLLEGQTDPKPRFVQLVPMADNFELKTGNYLAWQKQMIFSIQHCQKS